MYWLITLILLLPSLAYAEVAACNADGVKDAVIKGQSQGQPFKIVK